MRTLTLLIVLSVLAAITQSQDAKVILLTPPDATHAELTYKALQKAQDDWAKEIEAIKDKYLTVGYGDKEAGSEIVPIGGWTNGAANIASALGGAPPRSPTNEDIVAAQARELERQKHAKYQRSGWGDGFSFSSDFRFIVPRTSVLAQSQGQYQTFPCVNWSH